MERLTANLGPARREMLHGRLHLVAPVTMLREGVLQGSQGPIFYPADEVNKEPAIWNSVPIVVRHPTRFGQHVSARHPDIASAQQVGHVYRAQASGGKLTAEAWVDVEAARRVDPRVLAALESGQTMEVSTSLNFDGEPAPAGAAFNGVPYIATARRFRPDHLALLPDQRGACGLQDGCGLNVNQEKPMMSTEEARTIADALSRGGWAVPADLAALAANCGTSDVLTGLRNIGWAVEPSHWLNGQLIYNVEPPREPLGLPICPMGREPATLPAAAPVATNAVTTVADVDGEAPREPLNMPQISLGRSA